MSPLARSLSINQLSSLSEMHNDPCDQFPRIMTDSYPVIAVKVLDPHHDLRPGDMLPYAEGIKLNEMWGMYAAKCWS